MTEYELWHLINVYKPILCLLGLGGLILYTGIYGAIQARKGYNYELKKTIGIKNIKVCKILAYTAIPIGLGVIAVAVWCWKNSSI